MSGTSTPETVSLDRAHARALDAADALAPYRTRFAVPRREDGSPVVYLLGNSLGLMPDTARAAVEDEMQRWATLAVDGWFKGSPTWYEYHDSLRGAAARVVGAEPHEVVLMNTLTMNLHAMMISFYRPAGSRTKILMEENAFPSDRYAVASQVRMHGLDPATTVLVARAREGERTLRTEDVEALLAERGEEIALVVMGGVNYLSGQWFDVARLTAAAQAQGCVVGFDLAHAAGNVPLALHEWGVDFAVWCTYKYLNGGPGSIGGCFVHDRHAARHDLARLAGWWGNDPAVRFEMRETFEPHRGADGWQVSNPSMLAMAPVKASLELFDEVGMEALRAKSVKLTGYFETLLRAVASDRFTVVTPGDPAARGCQLSLCVPQGARDLYPRLGARGLMVDFREPDIIRAAPAPLYNSFEDVWTFVDELRSVMDEA